MLQSKGCPCHSIPSRPGVDLAIPYPAYFISAHEALVDRCLICEGAYIFHRFLIFHSRLGFLPHLHALSLALT